MISTFKNILFSGMITLYSLPSFAQNQLDDTSSIRVIYDKNLNVQI